MPHDPAPSETAAAAVLGTLKSCGIDHVLANPGTDFPSLIEVYADAPGAAHLPTPLVVHHESVAVAMAHGYYLASGRPAAVMVHVNVGLANCTMGAINAAAAEVPVVLLSGRTPVTETGRPGSRMMPIHWGQEMYDQAALVREAVKWEYELRYPEQAATAVARAVSAAMAAPRGPAYLALPREVLAQKVAIALPEARVPDLPGAPPNPGALDRAADLLARAANPLIVTQRTAPQGHLARLPELAERFAIPVAEFWPTVSAMPTTHPMHAGFAPGPLVAGADVILTIGATMPWTGGPGAAGEAKVIALGADPLDLGTPYRGFPTDVALAADPALALDALIEALAPRTGEMNLDARRAAQVARRAAMAEAADALVAAGAAGPMNHHYVSRVLSEEAGPEAAIFSELGAEGEALTLDNPGQLFWTPLSGGLGWGMPAALGVKLARPERPVIATVGDGSYIFANPTACHQVAALHGLPILTLVFNNGRWNAVKRATLAMYPDGKAAAANEMPLTGLGPAPDYPAIAAAHGAHAERVGDPGALRAAIRRALHATQVEKRQALLEVVVA